MELRQLVYFIEVAKQEHVSKAAEALHIAQSAVSRQVGNLETELGVQLLEKDGRNIKLTYIGKLFARQATIAIKAIDNAQQLVQEYLDPDQGMIRIGFPTSFANNILPSIILAFKKQYPDIHFFLRQGSYKFLIDGVKNREIDLSFIGPVPSRDPDIRADILFTEEFSALLPVTHPLAHEKSLSLLQLMKDSFVLFPEGFILRKIVEDACLQAGFRPSILFEGEDLDAIKGLVAAGLGVTLLPEVTLNDNLPHDTVKVKVTQPEVRRSVGLITPKHRELSPSETLFYNFAKSYFSFHE